MKALTALRSFVRRDEGQDLLEYALLISLIALVCVGAITTAGCNVKGIFEKPNGGSPFAKEADSEGGSNPLTGFIGREGVQLERAMGRLKALMPQSRSTNVVILTSFYTLLSSL